MPVVAVGRAVCANSMRVLSVLMMSEKNKNTRSQILKRIDLSAKLSKIKREIRERERKLETRRN